MILFIDNYDSFVYNLIRYVKELGQVVDVYRNDTISINDIVNQSPKAIILSPGPCTPNEAGICNDIIRQLSGIIPIFGVCLGHQCIGNVFGANIIKAPKAIHGKTSKITHNELLLPHQRGIFYQIPENFEVMRYHSLIIDQESLPPCLIKTSYLEKDESIIMAVRHLEHPTYGVQFHPESVGTEYGHQMLENFIHLSNSFWNQQNHHAI